MNTPKRLAHWSIEIVGGVLLIVSTVYLLVNDETFITDVPEIVLPALFAGSAVVFGRWLHHASVPLEDRQRSIVALGQLSGGVLFVLITGWILWVTALDASLPDDVNPILLNGAAIGMIAGGVLTALYLRLRNQQAVLERYNDRLEAQNEQLEKLASIVSHDLRSPLAVAEGRVKLAEETGRSEHFSETERALERMEAIISDMLTLTRQSATAPETTRVDLAVVAKSAWVTVDSERADLRVERSMEIQANEGRLRQAFENLFRNATDHGGESLTTVSVGTLGADGFYVEDDGAGIPPAEREDVFEWGTTTDDGGTGLGLAIVSEIVEAHGWTVRVGESESGGARFEVTGVGRS